MLDYLRVRYLQCPDVQCTLYDAAKTKIIHLHRASFEYETKIGTIKYDGSMCVCVVCRPCEVISSPGQVDLVSRWKTYTHTERENRSGRQQKEEKTKQICMHPKAGFVQKSIFNSLANVHWMHAACILWCCCCWNLHIGSYHLSGACIPSKRTTSIYFDVQHLNKSHSFWPNFLFIVWPNHECACVCLWCIFAFDLTTYWRMHTIQIDRKR